MKRKQSKTKKIVFLSSLTYTISLLLIYILTQQCHSPQCRVNDDEPLGILLFILLPLLPTFFLSLITYRMRDNVFRAWWNFARWWVPVIIVVTILLNTKGTSGGGYIGMDYIFDALVYTVLYGVLIIVSLVKIYRAYFRK